MKKFMEAYEEDEHRQKQQERLHKKHSIADESIVVVEKSNMIKFSINSFVKLIQFMATVLLVILAVIGLICIIFEETRVPLMDLINQIVNQIREEIS